MSGEGKLGTLHARLVETEPGLFKAEYVELDRERQPSSLSLPDSHLGTDPDGVRSWVEEMARGMGYDGVEWE